jgi:hypothetical protein
LNEFLWALLKKDKQNKKAKDVKSVIVVMIIKMSAQKSDKNFLFQVWISTTKKLRVFIEAALLFAVDFGL